MTNEKLFENFVDEKYGNYYRNIDGIIDHSYYHFGQISLIKKLIAWVEKNNPLVLISNWNWDYAHKLFKLFFLKFSI